MKFMRKRGYVKAARAESEAETREKIVKALVSLHEEIGPRRTSVSAVAERAGVQRLTVYRHFPDEDAMYAACSAHWAQLHPVPDFDGVTSARAILLALYAYYRDGRKMLANVFADAAHLPAMPAAVAPLYAFQESVARRLERCWRGRSSRRAATLRHAVQFTTWQSLAAITKNDAAAADLVLRWCDSSS